MITNDTLRVNTPEWLVLSPGFTLEAKTLYTLIVAHLAHTDDPAVPDPTEADLAELMGYRKRQTIAPYMAELTSADVIRRSVVQTDSGRRVVYRLPANRPSPSDAGPGPFPSISETAERRYRAVGDRDGWCCAYCSIPLANRLTRDGWVWDGGHWRPADGYGTPELDHVVPRSRGGANSLANIALACSICNARKSGKMLHELPPEWWR